MKYLQLSDFDNYIDVLLALKEKNPNLYKLLEIERKGANALRTSMILERTITHGESIHLKNLRTIHNELLKQFERIREI